MKPQAHAYTDGSCYPNPGPGGWGCVVRIEGGELEARGYSSKTTNNRMELTAVVRALEFLTVSCRVTVTTDSQYVAHAFTQGWLEGWQKRGWRTADGKDVKNRDLWQKLMEQVERHEVTWEWTKGHVGHPENERADRLASQGRKEQKGWRKFRTSDAAARL